MIRTMTDRPSEGAKKRECHGEKGSWHSRFLS
jgi:hypothetical protein